MPAFRNDFKSGTGDEPLEVARQWQRSERVLLSPQNQSRSFQPADLVVKFLVGTGESFQDTTNRGAVATLQMQGISQVNQIVRHQGFVVEHGLQHLAHMRTRGDIQVDRRLDRAGGDPCGVIQYQAVHLVRKPQRECGHDPSTQRMAEERSPPDSERLKKTLQYLHESGDAVGYVRFVRAAKPEQIQCDYAMRGGERLKAVGPLVGVTAKAMNEHKQWPAADVVVTDFPPEDGRVLQLGERRQNRLRSRRWTSAHGMHPAQRIFLPNADSASSTASSAVWLRSSSTGFTSTSSKLSMRPWSAMISIASCPSR